MAPEHWQVIADEIAKEIKKGTRGIVLMHGTDTMHYTSAALSFMLQNLPIPVVLVGAQRSSDRGSSDNQVNLICSCVVAKSDIGEVTVCMHANMNDEVCHVHRGTRVRKMHTSRRDAFQSINSLPIASVDYKEKKLEIMGEYKKVSSKGFETKSKVNGNVCLIHVHPIIKPEFIDSLGKLYDGVVLSTTGMGHVPTNPFNDKYSKTVLPSLKNLIESDIPVVIAPQALYGRLNLNVYTAGRMLNEIGVIGDQCDWLPEVALVKLMWALGQTKGIKKIRELMLTNVANEISDRSVVMP
ncbi:Glu-tRNA(Gln) amidotransferase subunit GatD [Candidatus Micrarchaeota archaeon]|nr:Glu-tRNA(Gln) amidotransferase subunit GatD [Candidatus Micrarchaeota archaeon]